jgi:beta-glucosidase
VGQLYLVSRNGQPTRRLVGFQRVDLARRLGPGVGQDRPASARRLEGWRLVAAAGEYGFALGQDADTLGPVVTVKVKGAVWKD